MKKNIIKLIVLYTLISSSNRMYAQIDTTYFNTLIQKYYKFTHVNIDSAENIIAKAYKYADSVNYTHGVIQCIYYNAYIINRKGDSEKSIDIAKSGLKLINSSEKFSKLESNLLRFIGIRYKNLHNYNQAEHYFKLSLKVAKSSKDSIDLSNVYYNFATLYEEKGNFNKAIDFYNKTRAIDFALGKLKNVSSTYNNLAILFKKTGDIEKAKFYINKAIDINKTNIDKFNLIGNYSTMASIYYSIDSLNRCLIYYGMADKLAKELGDKPRELSTQLNIATVYIEKKEYKKALKHIDNAESLAVNSIKLPKIKIVKSRALLQLNLLNESESLFKDLNENYFDMDRGVKISYLKLGRDLYKQQKNYEKAFYYLYKEKLLSDTINRDAEKKYVLETEAKFQNKIQEAENNHLLQQNQLKESKLKTQRILIGFGSVGIILLSLLSFIIFRQKGKQKKLNEVLAERNVKISLISREIAHRAKNQLALATNLISYQKNKAEDIGAKLLIEESENKLKALSAVNRRLSDDDELARVNLKEVIEEVVSNNIYSLSSSKIDYDISLPDKAIDSSKMSLIALIINELTTNSIKHAFEDNINPIIKVQGKINDNNLSMEYSDNGQTEKQVKTKGIGQNLISGLVNQLHGNYKIDVSLGFVFKLNMPI